MHSDAIVQESMVPTYRWTNQSTYRHETKVCRSNLDKYLVYLSKTQNNHTTQVTKKRKRYNNHTYKVNRSIPTNLSDSQTLLVQLCKITFLLWIVMGNVGQLNETHFTQVANVYTCFLEFCRWLSFSWWRVIFCVFETSSSGGQAQSIFTNVILKTRVAEKKKKSPD